MVSVIFLQLSKVYTENPYCIYKNCSHILSDPVYLCIVLLVSELYFFNIPRYTIYLNELVTRFGFKILLPQLLLLISITMTVWFSLRSNGTATCTI